MLWYPYTQMKMAGDMLELSHAKDNCLYLKDGKKLIDSVSSWWSTLHGYNNKEINDALIEQISKYSHVMMPGLKQDKSMQFAEALKEFLPGDLNYVFFSDSGSVAVEVALKMAIQYFHNKDLPEKKKIISLFNSYHGDTFKTMAIGDDPDYHGMFSEDSDSLLINPKISELEDVIALNKGEIAALIVEPLLQGGGGLQHYDIEFLRKAKEVCSDNNILLIFDEVATGFGRTGNNFVSDLVVPDIIVLGKALTAGYMGHAATVANKKVWEAFYSNDVSKTLMHGPTFMGNALACTVGLKSLEIYIRDNYLAKAKNIEKIFKREFNGFSHEKIKEIRILGASVVLELFDGKDKQGFKEHCISNGVWNRPFLKYIYSMPPLTISEEELLIIINTFKSYFK